MYKETVIFIKKKCVMFKEKEKTKKNAEPRGEKAEKKVVIRKKKNAEPKGEKMKTKVVTRKKARLY